MPELPTAMPMVRAELRGQGWSNQQLDRALRSGALSAPIRGILVAGPIDLDVQVRAARLAHRRRELVASHLTAARLLGLPSPLGGWTRPEFTARTGPRMRRPDIRITVCELPEPDIRRAGNMLITSPARTVVDCLRSLPPRDGLAMADAALHRGLAAPDDVADALSRQARWPGARRAAEVLSLADGRRESPLESWSAWAFEQVGLARPLWQVTVHHRSGTFLGRCDCWWPGVVGEADGKTKYRLAVAERSGPEARSVFDVLHEERKREEGLREARVEVVRWGAADVLSDPRAAELAGRVRAAQTLAAERGPYLARITLPSS